jgi:hypothetical protein
MTLCMFVYVIEAKGVLIMMQYILYCFLLFFCVLLKKNNYGVCWLEVLHWVT